jgi:hypothetical protein
MAAFAIAGFVLNIVSSYQYVRISAQLLFEMRLTLYRHLQACSPVSGRVTASVTWFPESTMMPSRFRGSPQILCSPFAQTSFFSWAPPGLWRGSAFPYSNSNEAAPQTDKHVVFSAI